MGLYLDCPGCKRLVSSKTAKKIASRWYCAHCGKYLGAGSLKKVVDALQS